MKKFLLPVATAIVSAAMLTACSDNPMVYEPGMTDTPLTGIPVQNSVVLTDAEGNAVSSLSGAYGKYYLNIETEGEWNVSSQNAFINLPCKSGKGNARIPVQVGNNWVGDRDYQIDVQFAEGATRAGENTGSASGTQTGTSTATELKEFVSSNIFVGYAFTPGRSDTPEFCTGLSVFDVPALVESNKALDSYYETSNQKFYESESDSTLDKSIVGGGNVGGAFKKFGFELNGDGGTWHSEGKAGRSAQMTLIQTHFTREIDLANLVDDNKKLTNTTNGYEYFKARFINAIKAAGSNEAVKTKSVQEFIDVVGSHLVTKASLGTQLDYRIHVDSTYLNDSIGVKAVLGCKFQSVVKPEMNDSTAAKQDSTHNPTGEGGGNTFDLNLYGGYSNGVKNAASKTDATIQVRGGQVSKVNILVSGGSLSASTVAEWQLTIEPKNATIVGIHILPIYNLFDPSDADEAAAMDALRKYVDANYSLKEEKKETKK